MKVGVVGCGAVGSYYGARLALSGHETHFLLRSGCEIVMRNGVRIESPNGDFHVRVQCARHPSEIGHCDVVLVALKTTANSLFEKLVAPLAGPQTLVVTMQNGLGNEDALARFLPAESVMGALCSVCLNRLAPGVIRHLAHGQVVMGSFAPRADSCLEMVAENIRRSGIPCSTTPNLAQARWEKLVWNIPFNGLGVASAAGFDAVRGGVAPEGRVASCLTTDVLIKDPGWEALVRGLMAEVIAAARLQRLPLADSMIEEKIGLTRAMGPYKPSTLLDFENGLPLELESMFREPLRRAKAAGASVPLMESLCSVLEKLDQRRGRE